MIDLDTFQGLLTLVKDINPDQLDRSSDFGEMAKGEEIKKSFIEIRDILLNFIDVEDGRYFPSPVLTSHLQKTILDDLHELCSLTSRVEELNPDTVNEYAKQIKDGLSSMLDNVKSKFAPYYYLIEKRHLDDVVNVLERKISHILQLEEQLVKNANKAEGIVKKLERFETQGSKSAAKEAINELEDVFTKAGKKAGEESWRWLAGVVIFAVLIFLTVISGDQILSPDATRVVFWGKENLIDTSTIQKFLGIILFATFLRFCINNYRISKHLVEVNNFRARVMNTVERIISWEGMSEENQNILLKDASHSIFNLNGSGYLSGKDSDAGDGVIINFPHIKN